MCTNTNLVVHVTAVLSDGSEQEITLCPGESTVDLDMVQDSLGEDVVHYEDGPYDVIS